MNLNNYSVLRGGVIAFMLLVVVVVEYSLALPHRRGALGATGGGDKLNKRSLSPNEEIYISPFSTQFREQLEKLKSGSGYGAQKSTATPLKLSPPPSSSANQFGSTNSYNKNGGNFPSSGGGYSFGTGNQYGSTNSGNQFGSTNSGNQFGSTNSGNQFGSTNSGNQFGSTNSGNQFGSTNSGNQFGSTNSGNQFGSGGGGGSRNQFGTTGGHTFESKAPAFSNNNVVVGNSANCENTSPNGQSVFCGETGGDDDSAGFAIGYAAGGKGSKATGGVGFDPPAPKVG